MNFCASAGIMFVLSLGHVTAPPYGQCFAEKALCEIARGGANAAYRSLHKPEIANCDPLPAAGPQWYNKFEHHQDRRR